MEKENNEDVHHMEDAQANAGTTADLELQGWVGLAQDARDATDAEHNLTVWKAVKLYPKACLWSMVVSLVIIMDGYDTALIGNLFGYPSFQKRFGVEVSNTGTYQLQAKWQTALGISGSLGNIVGIFINGIVTERFGHNKAVLGSLAILVGFLFILSLLLTWKFFSSAKSSAVLFGVSLQHWPLPMHLKSRQ